MKCIQLLLNNNDKFIFGNHRRTIDNHYTSDRLFSNLISNLDKIGYSLSEIEEVINSFNENNVKISSLLWGITVIDKQRNKTVKDIYFFPFPKAYISNENILEAKIMSHIKYISVEAIKKLKFTIQEDDVVVSGKCHDFNMKEFAIIQDKFLVLKDELEEVNNIKLFNKSIKDHNIIDRTTGMSDIYFNNYLEVNYTETINYSYQPFMYFILQGEITQSIQEAIELIKYDAIGGKKSTGNGRVKDIVINEFAHRNMFNSNSKYYTNLSVVIPNKNELSNIESYSMEIRNGYAYSSWNNDTKKPIYVIQEGAIFSNIVQGKIADVTPIIKDYKEIKHKIYRYGKALLLPLGGDDSGK
jgi:CRISPR type III-A-associated RAMP protein Csm4